MESEPPLEEEMPNRGNFWDTAATQEQRKEARREAVALIPRIEKAFEDMGPPPKVTLRVARALDDEWHFPEARRRELAAEDPEENWQEVSDEKIEVYHEYFTFADDEGRRFYLPAYLRHYLRRYPGCCWDAVVGACECYAVSMGLNDEQLACVHAFLELRERYRHLDG